MTHNMWQIDMGCHHARGTSLNTAVEGYQLDGFQSIYGGCDSWQRQVRVGRGITMAGEMFERGYDACCAMTPHRGGCETRDFGRIFAKGTHANHRIGGIVIDINDRSPVHIYAERFELLSRCQGYIIGQLFRSSGSQGHVAGKYCGALPEPAHVAIFLVNGDQQWLTVPGLPGDCLQALC